MEVKRATTISPKNVRTDATKLRLPIGDFTSRRVGTEYDDYDPNTDFYCITSGNIQCFKEDIYCEFSINLWPNDFDDYEEGELLHPYSYSFFLDGFHYYETKMFYCKVWLENEKGEKFWEDTLDQDALGYEGVDSIYYGNYSKKFDFGDLDLSELLTNDKAIFCAECFFPIGINDYVIPIADSDFRRALWLGRNDGFTDCTLKVEGKELKASKTILTTQSEVFKSMMKMNSIEAQTGIIEIPDASYEAVEVFLEFFYVGYAENLDIFVEELFVIADRYFVESLKNLCQERMVKTLDESNVLERLILAFRFNNRHLKSKILAYVADLDKAIFESAGWQEFARKEKLLAEKIASAVAEKIES